SGLVGPTSGRIAFRHFVENGGPLGENGDIIEIDDLVYTGGSCPADADHDGHITPADVATFVNIWFTSLSAGTLDGDFDGNGVVAPADVASFVSAWFNALANGC